MKRNKKRLEDNMILANYGITIVALIITIIIIIILATVTINFTFGEDGIITKANQAKYMVELSTFQEELGMFKANKALANSEFSPDSITAGETSLIYNTKGDEAEENNIYDVLTSLENSTFAGKMEIIKGELLINSQDMEEIKVAQSMGIEVNPYIIEDGELKSDGANLALMDSTGTLTIPDGVTSIGEGAFADLSGLKTIIIPGTVIEIKRDAFRNNADLETVIIEEGVEVIGESAFEACGKLITVKLPESLIEIKTRAFYTCERLDNVKIPSNILSIDYYTFYNCSKLNKIELPNKLQTIRSNAFQYCINLEEIYIPGNVNSIENNVFSNCTKLKNIEIADENQYYIYDKTSGMLITSDGERIVFISDNILNSTNTFIIPEGVTSFNTGISAYKNINTIIIPKSLQTITNCDVFPETVINIEVADGNNYFTVENECLYNKNKTTLIMCFAKDAEPKLAETILNISPYAFKGALNIINVDLPDSVTSIGAFAFEKNTKIENIKIGANVNYIDPFFKYTNYSGTVTIDNNNQNYCVEDKVLYNKDKTEIITILYKINGQYTVKDGVTKLGYNAFHNQNKMTEIVLPDSLKEINSSFNFCNSLTHIYIPNSVEIISERAFSNSPNLTQIQIDKEPGSIVGSPWGAIRGDRIVEWLR